MIRPTPAQRGQFEAEGCLTLAQALPSAQLQQVQQVFDRCAREAKPQWLEGVAQGRAPAAYFDLPHPLECDPLFIDLVDHPSYYGLLMDFTGGELLFLGPQFRTLPPSPLSYVGWHYDVERSNPLHLKVQLYLNDVGADEGAFAYVPGSHLPEAGPYPLVRRLESMPGHRVFYGRAGDAVLFNSYGMHTSMVNKTPRPRRSIILIYEQRTPAQVSPQRFAALADRLLTPERRRLFGLE
ncbi:MAG: phytanoyl-CoA dioxygenase family protein [Candidatus Latescibacteria bacterium]|nr:phytanoyl-CoA dioxygenase family protein [Candidatus Latescibacterota bacterium]